MPDMLCSLVRLPDATPLIQQLHEEGITIRRPNPWDRSTLEEFIVRHFSRGWADEALVAFTSKPITCFIALDGEKIIGFGAYECTRRNFFGPTGVNKTYRGRGIGKALFLACLQGLQELGYVYAIIGDAGPVEFYKKAVGAMIIPIDEGRGIYGLDADPRYLSK